MKKIITILALLVSTGSFAQVTGAKLQAAGLTCSMCSKAVYQALRKVSFVETVKSNIQESSYSLTFKKDAVVDFDELSKAVVDAGFSVAKLQVTANFNNVAVGNDKHVELDGKSLHFLNVPEQSLNGEKTIILIDRQFTSSKEHKKYSGFTTMKCFESGKMENGEKVYHVTI
ncbi:heavy-metal-associated domain-containing protein [Foetidibacter luteolus]|uniref:heavy-metal-associated domain-containing protein n=1 Tax=Foetidibacter luteolus TaxID=2608880 RepID=UPI00129BD91A|nr:heavy-metal-associated domain-containing protein [Foetidibacter luteolus]